MPDALRDHLVERYAAALAQMNDGIGKIACGLYSLSSRAACDAVYLDPNALGRILDRMQNLGDATVRQIEGRIGVTISREDRKQLQDLRDEMRDWLAARDDQREGAQTAVDELNAYAATLRERS
jgi:hypothetical protein